MRSATLAYKGVRCSSISAVPPARDSPDYSTDLAELAKDIIYRSPIPHGGTPLYIATAAAIPDAKEVDFDSLLPYVLARLPSENELIEGRSYEIIFFTGDETDGPTKAKKSQPSLAWFLKAYKVLPRVLRKRLQKLYIVHEKPWVRFLLEAFSTVVTPKSRKKLYHAPSLSALSTYIAIEDLLIPPGIHLFDRRVSPNVSSASSAGRRAFGVSNPLPKDAAGRSKLPRILRETTSFILMKPNIESEGIFRISPYLKLVGVVREAYERGQKYIIWKDHGVMLPCPSYPEAVDATAALDEVRVQNAYSVLLAASLIKEWYKALQKPIFPPSCYRDLRIMFGAVGSTPTLQSLIDLLSVEKGRSLISATSQEILVRHLLPLLSRITESQESNKMSAENLAICFAPVLLYGPDQVEDARMSVVIRSILESAVTSWEGGLRKALDIGSELDADLRHPALVHDYEDPVDETSSSGQSDEKGGDFERQYIGVMDCAAVSDDDSEHNRPPLPPRQPGNPESGQAASAVPTHQITGYMRRKPVPKTAILPRYSAIIPSSAFTDENASGQCPDRTR